MAKRPHVQARPYAWLTGTDALPGIGLLRGQQLIAHLTEDEARRMADKLHDLADKLTATPTRQDGPPAAANPTGRAPATPTPLTARRAAHAAALTAADGTEEPRLPATIAD